MRPSLTFETLTVVYLLVLAIGAAVTRAATPRRTYAIALCVVASAAVALLAPRASPNVRLWLGHLYLAGGYWIPALLAVPAPGSRFEAWLIRSEARLRPHAPFILTQAGPSTRAILETAYLLCYPLVPAAFIVMWVWGTAADAQRFWIAVLAAGFACYGTLPWLVSRPPRALEPTTASPAARANVYVLERVSHGMNTFPSGHVAVSLAAALQVFDVSPVAGIVFGVVAIAIAAGAIAGRYHYTIDVVIGLLLGVGTGLL